MIRISLNSKNSIYGIIEKGGEGEFFASTHGVKNMAAISATGRTAKEAERRLEQKSRICLSVKALLLFLLRSFR